MVIIQASMATHDTKWCGMHVDLHVLPSPPGFLAIVDSVYTVLGEHRRRCRKGEIQVVVEDPSL